MVKGLKTSKSGRVSGTLSNAKAKRLGQTVAKSVRKSIETGKPLSPTALRAVLADQKRHIGSKGLLGKGSAMQSTPQIPQELSPLASVARQYKDAKSFAKSFDVKANSYVQKRLGLKKVSFVDLPEEAKKSFPSADSKGGNRELFEKDGVYILLSSGRDRVNTVFVDEIYIHPKGTGMGGKIMMALHDYAVAHGSPNVLPFKELSNPLTKKFYDRFDFVPRDGAEKRSLSQYVKAGRSGEYPFNDMEDFWYKATGQAKQARDAEFIGTEVSSGGLLRLFGDKDMAKSAHAQVREAKKSGKIVIYRKDDMRMGVSSVDESLISSDDWKRYSSDGWKILWKRK